MPTIQALRVQNFKRLSNIEIEPGSRQFVVIGGDNAQGKSSVLDAIMGGIAGKSALPAEPIHRGESKGQIEVVLDDGVTIRRTITKKPDGSTGGTLKITTADGMTPAGGAQKWLDARVGAMTVDPLSFMSRDDKAQASMLREVAGIDTSEVDARIARLREDRRLKGREVRSATGAADRADRYPDAPKVAPEPAIVSASDVLAEVQAAEATQRAVEDARRDLTTSQDAVKKGEEAIASVDSEIARLEGMLAEARAKHERYTEALALRRAACVSAEESFRVASSKVVDPAPIRARLASLEQANNAARAEAAEVARQVAANAEADAKRATADALQAEYDQYTTDIDASEAERRSIIASADLPVDGLGLSEDGSVLFNGIPLAQASQAEKMRVSMAIALAGTPADGIRIVLIRDASLLDRNSMQMVADLAREMDAQVWLERVGDADDGAVIIHDGGVV